MKSFLTIFFLIYFKFTWANYFTPNEIATITTFLTDTKAPKLQIAELYARLKIYNDLEIFLNDDAKRNKTLLFRLGKEEFFAKMAKVLVKADKSPLNDRISYLGKFIIKNYLENLKDEIGQYGHAYSEAFIIVKGLIDLLEQSVKQRNLSNKKWYDKDFSSTINIFLEIESILDSAELGSGPITSANTPLTENVNLVKRKSTPKNNNAAFIPQNSTEEGLLKLFNKLPKTVQASTSPRALLFDFIGVDAMQYRGLDFHNTLYDQPVNGDFEMMKYEVSQLLYFAIMGFNRSPKIPCVNKIKVETERNMGNNRVIKDEWFICPFHLASYISAKDALLFVKIINSTLNDGYEYAIPTDAQWGLAVREDAKQKTPFYINGGVNLLKEYARFASDYPAAGNDLDFLPNPRGFYHMLGNVREWVSRDLTKIPKGANFCTFFQLGHEWDLFDESHKKYEKVVYYFRGGNFQLPVSIINYGRFSASGDYGNAHKDATTGLRLVRKRKI